MDRKDVLKSMFAPTGFGLEIGPSYNPLLRKSDGYNVEIVDYTDTATLRQLHKGVDIEEVDYVTDGQSLASVIPCHASYDFVIASHVIEHTPDLIQFFKDCTTLLKPDGVLVLAVPDKRHCFDLFQSVTSTGDVLQAHFEKRTRPLASRHFDHHAYAVRRGTSIVWHMGYTEPTNLVHPLKTARDMFLRATATKDYMDAHAWYFLPSSFRLIVRDLFELGEIRLREAGFIDSTGPEFYITLSRAAPGCQADRLSLIRAAAAEARVPPVV